jgi:hypothetical protein
VTTIARIVCFFPSLLAAIDLDAGGMKRNAGSRPIDFGRGGRQKDPAYATRRLRSAQATALQQIASSAPARWNRNLFDNSLMPIRGRQVSNSKAWGPPLHTSSRPRSSTRRFKPRTARPSLEGPVFAFEMLDTMRLNSAPRRWILARFRRNQYLKAGN